jgi:hypothetical protein
MKKQKYITIMFIVGLMIMFYPFLGIYTINQTYNDGLGFFEILFTNLGFKAYAPYIATGLVISSVALYLDFKE